MVRVSNPVTIYNKDFLYTFSSYDGCTACPYGKVLTRLEDGLKKVAREPCKKQSPAHYKSNSIDREWWEWKHVMNWAQVSPLSLCSPFWSSSPHKPARTLGFNSQTRFILSSSSSSKLGNFNFAPNLISNGGDRVVRSLSSIPRMFDDVGGGGVFAEEDAKVSISVRAFFLLN
ncbi:hypothetical protein Sjap_022720 [Stephania japonica]|uniref:Uncharacterized protein n=1 Tax=Stephania japonica TaxID=461633 RepID=A0AAP0EWL5_9MAGN